MTVTYSRSIATSSNAVFLKLLLRWKGSVYKLIWQEFLVFSLLYGIISITYRLALHGQLKRNFEAFCLYCEGIVEQIPVGFVLGFYINTVVSRWWEQVNSLMWPDSWALTVCAFASGDSEKVRLQRCNLLRYFNLSYCFGLIDFSSRFRRLFPKPENLVEAGMMTQEELELYRASVEDCSFGVYFLPLVWAEDLVDKMYQEKSINDKRKVECLIQEVLAGRLALATLYTYDMLKVPLVYTQVSTITVYLYFAVALFAWQMLDPAVYSSPDRIDIYVPVFGLLRLIFYMGWLKVALTIMNPFGNEVDDFELEAMLQRNSEFCSFWDKAYNGEIPPVTYDFGSDGDFSEHPKNAGLPETVKNSRRKNIWAFELPTQSLLAHSDRHANKMKFLSF